MKLREALLVINATELSDEATVIRLLTQRLAFFFLAKLEVPGKSRAVEKVDRKREEEKEDLTLSGHVPFQETLRCRASLFAQTGVGSMFVAGLLAESLDNFQFPGASLQNMPVRIAVVNCS